MMQFPSANVSILQPERRQSQDHQLPKACKGDVSSPFFSKSTAS